MLCEVLWLPYNALLFSFPAATGPTATVLTGVRFPIISPSRFATQHHRAGWLYSCADAGSANNSPHFLEEVQIQNSCMGVRFPHFACLWRDDINILTSNSRQVTRVLKYFTPCLSSFFWMEIYQDYLKSVIQSVISTLAVSDAPFPTHITKIDSNFSLIFLPSIRKIPLCCCFFTWFKFINCVRVFVCFRHIFRPTVCHFHQLLCRLCMSTFDACRRSHREASPPKCVRLRLALSALAHLPLSVEGDRLNFFPSQFDLTPPLIDPKGSMAHGSFFCQLTPCRPKSRREFWY